LAIKKTRQLSIGTPSHKFGQNFLAGIAHTRRVKDRGHLLICIP